MPQTSFTKPENPMENIKLAESDWYKDLDRVDYRAGPANDKRKPKNLNEKQIKH